MSAITHPKIHTKLMNILLTFKEVNITTVELKLQWWLEDTMEAFLALFGVLMTIFGKKHRLAELAMPEKQEEGKRQ